MADEAFPHLKDSLDRGLLALTVARYAAPALWAGLLGLLALAVRDIEVESTSADVALAASMYPEVDEQESSALYYLHLAHTIRGERS
ncbi:MAG: hypothetical protein ACOY0T_09505 [Myxococcota bacterium]